MVATACTTDTESIQLTQNLDGSLQADLLVSTQGSNGAELLPDGLWVPLGFGCSVIRTTTQAIGDSAAEMINFGTNLPGSQAAMHSTSVQTSRIVCIRDGWYALHGDAYFDNDADGYRRLRLMVNGSPIASANSANISGGTTQHREVNKTWFLAVGDYVELEVFHTAGNSLDILPQASYSPNLSAFLL